MSEDYFEELGGRIKDLKSEIKSLEDFKQSLITSINKLKAEKEEASKSTQKFIDDEMKKANKKMKEIKDEVDKKLETEKSRANSLDKREEKIKQDELNLGKEKKEAEIERIELSRLHKRLNDLVDQAEKELRKNLADKEFLEQELKHIAKKHEQVKSLLEDAKLKSRETHNRLLVSVRQTEKRESLLNERAKALNVREGLLREDQRELENEKRKIADQWYQINKAKNG